MYAIYHQSSCLFTICYVQNVIHKVNLDLWRELKVCGTEAVEMNKNKFIKTVVWSVNPFTLVYRKKKNIKFTFVCFQVLSCSNVTGRVAHRLQSDPCSTPPLSTCKTTCFLCVLYWCCCCSCYCCCPRTLFLLAVRKTQKPKLQMSQSKKFYFTRWIWFKCTSKPIERTDRFYNRNWRTIQNCERLTFLKRKQWASVWSANTQLLGWVIYANTMHGQRHPDDVPTPTKV